MSLVSEPLPGVRLKRDTQAFERFEQGLVERVDLDALFENRLRFGLALAEPQHFAQMRRNFSVQACHEGGCGEQRLGKIAAAVLDAARL